MTLQQHDKCLQTDFSPRGQIGPHPHYTYLHSYKHRNAELRDSAWVLKLPVTRSPLRHTETQATATHFKGCMYNFQPERHVPAQLNEVTLTPCLWMLRMDETVRFHLALQISQSCSSKFAVTFQVRNSHQAALLSNLLLLNLYLYQDKWFTK